MIAGYRFAILEGETRRTVFLRGSGGRLGDGTLAAPCDPARVSKRTRQLLAQARAMLARVELVEHVDTPDTPGRSFETRRIAPDAVVDVVADQNGGV